MALLAAVGPASAIIGGYLVAPGQLPFAARILITNGGSQSQCSGSVVRANVVMTAAHCVVDAATGRTLAARDFVVLTAGPDASAGITYRHGVGNVTRFPGFAVATRRGDVALLQLTSASSAAVHVAGAADASWAYRAGRGILVAGFGQLRANGPYSASLHAVQLAIVGDATCAADDARGLPYVPTAMFCGAHGASPEGICYGDSGGPVLEPNAHGVVLEVGVTSYVSSRSGSCSPPSYFVRLAAFAPWLSGQITHLQLTSACPTLRVLTGQAAARVAQYRRLLRRPLTAAARRRLRAALARAEAQYARYLASSHGHACG